MRRKALALGAGVVLAASVAVPAMASDRCVGTDKTVKVCVVPQGETLVDDCVYAGPGRCTPVQLMGPSYYCEGPYAEWCAIDIIEPQQ